MYSAHCCDSNARKEFVFASTGYNHFCGICKTKLNTSAAFAYAGYCMALHASLIPCNGSNYCRSCDSTSWKSWYASKALFAFAGHVCWHLENTFSYHADAVSFDKIAVADITAVFRYSLNFMNSAGVHYTYHIATPQHQSSHKGRT